MKIQYRVLFIILSFIFASTAIFFMVSTIAGGVSGVKLFIMMISSFFSGIFCIIPVTIDRLPKPKSDAGNGKTEKN